MGDEKKGDDVLTTQQVIEEYKISRTSLYRLKVEGILLPIETSPLLAQERQNTYLRADIERAAEILRERKRGRKPKQA